MNAPQWIVLPRLHATLTDLPQGAALLWPGLPSRYTQADIALPSADLANPKASVPPVFRPNYPWSPSMAAACLEDMKSLAQEGAKGAPVRELAAGAPQQPRQPGLELSPAEQRALAAWQQAESSSKPFDRPLDQAKPFSAPGAPNSTGDSAEDAPASFQSALPNAHHVLLLAWLREQQALELRDLERRVHQSQNNLDAWLGEGPTPLQGESVAVPLADLPPWRDVLEAAWPFLFGEARIQGILVMDAAAKPESPESLKSLESPRSRESFDTFASAVLAAAAKYQVPCDIPLPEGLPASFGGAVSCTWTAFRLTLGQVLGRKARFGGDNETALFCCPVINSSVLNEAELNRPALRQGEEG